MRLRTRRLLLRPVSPRDAEFFHALDLLPEVSEPAGFLPSKTVRETRAKLRAQAAEWKKKGLRRMAFTFVLRRTGKPIGGMSLRWPHAGVGELGYMIHPDHQGRGYATEAVGKVVALAFERFRAHRVQATCWVRNEPSVRVLRKLGFRKEGRLRGYLKRGDAVRDEFIFGRRAPRRERR